MTLHDFDAIRPLSPEELPAAFDQLLADPQFCGILQMLFKDIPLDILKAKLYTCKTNLDVQKTFLYPLIKDLLSKCSTGITMDDSAIAPEKRGEAYTYVSNHRDIVLDSALLNVQMIERATLKLQKSPSATTFLSIPGFAPWFASTSRSSCNAA